MSERVSVLIERLTRLVQNDAQAEGLKPTQWEALRYIVRANLFSRSPGALTAYLGMTKGTVSQTLQALERKGLIEKKTVDGDRRGVQLALTKAGHRILDKDPLNALAASIAGMPQDAQGTFETTLENLIIEMLERRGGRAFGACKTCRHFRGKHSLGTPHFCSLLNESLSRSDSEQICAEQTAA